MFSFFNHCVLFSLTAKQLKDFFLFVFKTIKPVLLTFSGQLHTHTFLECQSYSVANHYNVRVVTSELSETRSASGRGVEFIPELLRWHDQIWQNSLNWKLRLLVSYCWTYSGPILQQHYIYGLRLQVSQALKNLETKPATKGGATSSCFLFYC